VAALCGHNGYMESIGVRELKSHLSAYLRKVSGGEVIQVTDHGRVVAELRQPLPLARDGLPFLYWEKVARGEIWPAKQPNTPGFYDELVRSPGAPEGTAQRLIDEDRGD
jgi:antitoxin (DNA-binding transcriptional repressor) of toxin-antitoxin stability system